MGFNIWQTNLMSIRDVLAGNFKKLKDSNPALATPTLLVARGVLSNGTLGRIANSEVNLGIDHLEPLANVYGVEPWQLLDPKFDPPGEESDSFFRLFESVGNLDGDLARATVEADDNVSQQRFWHKEIYEYYRAKSIPPEGQQDVNNRFRPTLTTASCFSELSKIIGQLSERNRDRAKAILVDLATNPDDYAVLAAQLDVLLGSGNASTANERQPKSTNSSGR
jgi:transcriptional regulator with XRE-family HTH domain